MEFGLLGPLEVVGDDASTLPIGGQRPRALLAALLLEANRPISVDRLIDAVWGESPPASGAGALQVHVHTLRKALGPERIVTRPPGYVLVAHDGEVDADRFAALVRQGESALASADPRQASELLHSALALWRGPALADLAYESFAQGGAAALEEQRLAAVELRLEADLALGRHADLVAELEMLVREHPLRERLRAQLMLALYRSGRQGEALAAYQEARRILVDELGLDPGADLRELEQAILRQDAALDLPSAARADRPEPARLPVPATALVGRDLELASVQALLARADVRLVTLTGAGGTGKTRLATAAASADAVFVDLSPVRDAELVVPTIARTLGVAETPVGSPVDAVVAALPETSTLLVLDNLEQVLEAAPQIAELLFAASQLRILATSRAPLRISAEHEYRVRPLGVPDQGKVSTAEIADAESVRLYVDRARAVVPGFELTEANAPAIARICRALDGLPLAIELAAARVRALGPEGTAARVGERLALLSRGARDLPERQRSLRATIDWSVQLLDEPAARMFRSLAVFSGGASLEAAEAVCADCDLSALDELLDAGLATHSADSGGKPRFGMLETVREYALEQLAASGEERAARDRHLAWFLALVEGDDVYWRRNLSSAWLGLVELEHDNMRAAFTHARAIEDVERELRLACALRYYWRLRGYVHEGRRRLDEAVKLSKAVDPPLQARVLGEAGVMAFAGADYQRSRELWQRAFAISEELGDTREQARAMTQLGACAHVEQEVDTAVACYESARDLFDGVDDPHGRGILLANLAAAYESLEDYERARSAAIEALEVQERIGDEGIVAITSFNLASLEVRAGDVEDAAAHLARSLTASLSLGYVEVTAYGLGIAAELAAAGGRHKDAGVLLGSFLEVFREVGTRPQAAEAERHERVVAAVQAEVDLEPILVEGHARTLESAVELALDVTSDCAKNHLERG
jgi:predicted ATPase/DNA-binding SARP family transcriptional activator